MNEVVATPLPRPPQIPAEVTDSLLLECVRDYLMGEKDDVVALKLAVSVQMLHSVVRSSAWRLLQNHFRDEFLATSGARMIRLESKLIDKLESYVDHGLECWGQRRGEEGLESFSYQRQLSPKEAVSIALLLNDTNKRLDHLREGDVSRKKWDAAEMIRKLERAAKGVSVDGEAQRVG